eukprot:NODE_34_length_2947_cov_246.958592_g29_i0.p1 GENE.NODE_34_length_2947_cov_246.958592_g29_i0~~NODE_34_length_2947_cov_246.958592_g29_i0.p1  ORF type:complete len:919 (-),score=203.04 NODE_34_length_2947_cov_246.958592_g29_i0:128-2884(-)
MSCEEQQTIPATHIFSANEFSCPICLELLHSPRTCSCGHTFCEHCLERWLDNGSDGSVTCPVDRKPLPINIPEVNILMQELIRQGFAAEYFQRANAVEESRRCTLLRELRFIFCRSLQNSTMVQVLISDEQGYLQRDAVISAMLRLPRGEFVPPSVRQEAYELHPLRLHALDFNVSAPNMYAMCLESLQLAAGQTFLDIGAGCGLLTVLAAQLVGPEGTVHGIDVQSDIVAFAIRNLDIQKRRHALAHKQRQMHESCPRTGRLIPGATFIGRCSEHGGQQRYDAKLRIDAREGNTVIGRFYWHAFGRTMTHLEGTIDALPEEEKESSTSTSVSLTLVEKQILGTRQESILWMPCTYHLRLDVATGVLSGAFAMGDMEPTQNQLSLHCMDLPTEDVELDVVEFFTANCFLSNTPPMSGMLESKGGYDRIHCGATCPRPLLPRLTKLLAPGGIMIVPVESHLTKVEKSSEGEVTSTNLLAVRYGNLEVPVGLGAEDGDDEEHEVGSGTITTTAAAVDVAVAAPDADDNADADANANANANADAEAVGDAAFPTEDSENIQEEGEDDSSPAAATAISSSSTTAMPLSSDKSDGKLEGDRESDERRKKRKLDPTEDDGEGEGELKSEEAPVESPFQYFTKCCGVALVRTADVVPESEVERTVGEVLQLPDGPTLMCLKVHNVVDDFFQYVTPLLNGKVCNVKCKCGLHLGIKFLGEPEERGDNESYDGRTLITKAYVRSSSSDNKADDQQSAAVAAPLEGDRLQCVNCRAVLGGADQVLNTQHRWALEGGDPERAALVNWVDPAAIIIGQQKQAKMVQGTASYAPVRCAHCDNELGWQFLTHVHYYERAQLSWYRHRYGLVVSRVAGITVQSQSLTLTLAQLMQHLALAGLLRVQREDEGEQTAGTEDSDDANADSEAEDTD